MRAHVEYAVTAWSCSPSNANVCAKAIHAGPKRGSISEVLLHINEFLGRSIDVDDAHLKYVRASDHFF